MLETSNENFTPKKSAQDGGLAFSKRRKGLEARKAMVPDLYAKIFDKVATERGVTASKVKTVCFECQSVSPNSIRWCESAICPLWEKRPYRKGQPPEWVKKIREKRRQKMKVWIKTVPLMFRNTQLKAILEGKRGAVVKNAMCQQCLGFCPEEIRTCTDYGCGLWDDRPYQHKHDGGESEHP